MNSLPDQIVTRLNDAGMNVRDGWLIVDTDVSLVGHAQRHWLIAAKNVLLIVEEHSAGKIVERCWDEFESFRTTSGVGSGLLQAKVDGQWIDLLRYSNQLAHRFHKVSRRLEQYLEQPDAGVPPTVAEELDPPRCP
ncbi:MAG: hypothetical protein KDA92_25150, partial [Planctomycetales bacterium]|nr:hypothetical protein [Planctomycetales bacterium]